MSVFTFTRTTQWCFEVIQALAESEARARELIKDTYTFPSQYYVESVFSTSEINERIVFSRYIDNEAYEG